MSIVNESVDYASFSVSKLKGICKDKGIKGYSKKNEAELIEMIKGVE